MKNEMVFWVSKDADGEVDGWSRKPFYDWKDGSWYVPNDPYQRLYPDLVESFQLDEQIEPGEAAEIRITFDVMRKEKGE